MICANKSFHGGSHAFRDELYHKQRAGVFMGGGIVAQRETGQGSRLEMHRRGGVGHLRCARRRLALYFRECRLPAIWLWPPSDQAVMTPLEEGLAQDFAGLGTTIEQRLERTAAASHATPGMERRHRLALAALLRTTVPKPQRTVATASPSRGPAKFHAYASACIVEYGSNT